MIDELRTAVGGKLPDGATLGSVAAVVAIVVAMVGAYAVRPLFQAAVYSILFKHPVFLSWLVVSAVLGGGILLLGPRAGGLSREQAGTYAFYAVAGLSVITVLVVFPLSVQATNQHLADRATADMQTVDDLPETDSESLRLLPREKANVAAENSFQKPRHKVGGEMDITYVDGRPTWSAPTTPDSGGERWSGAQNGSIYVDMTSGDPSVTVVEGDVEKGQGVVFYKSNKWHMQNHRYFVQYGEAFVVTEDLGESESTRGDTHIVRPLVKHEWQFKYGIIPYTVPTSEGVAMSGPDGDVQYLSPQEAASHELLENQNFYPYDLHKQEIRSLTWQDGLINKFWFKNGVFNIAEPDRDYGNSLPYTVWNDEQKPLYYTPVSPQGSGDGVFAVFIADGQTGEMTKYTPPADEKVVGSQKISLYVKGDTPEGVTTWEEYKPVEPIPVSHDGDLYWMVRVIAADGTGMPAYGFINAENPDETVFATGDDKDELARAFVDGEDISDRSGAVSPTPSNGTDGDGSVTIVIKQDGETVGTYNVTDDTTVEFRTGNETATDSEDDSEN